MLYRVSGGRLGNRLMGAPILLLTVKGRKTGKAHTTPLIYMANEDQVVLVASKGGYERHPEWYLNLTANPEVSILIKKERSQMVARTATVLEKKRLWPRMVEMYKGYEDYQRSTDRDIPLILLKKS